jgi:general nucleoside transport system ATP-binding protein
LRARDRSGLKDINIDRPQVRAGEILGIAGVSGNGQMELMEVLTGQRRLQEGEIAVKGTPYRATRAKRRRLQVRYPARGTAAQRLRGPHERDREHRLSHFRLNGSMAAAFGCRAAMRDRAARCCGRSRIKTASLDARISSLVGGQCAARGAGARTDRACRGAGDLEPLLRARFLGGGRSATADRRGAQPWRGVLLMSEDLDEVLELSDRVLVMSEGRSFETPIEKAPMSPRSVTIHGGARVMGVIAGALPFDFALSRAVSRSSSSTCSATLSSRGLWRLAWQ